MNIRIVKYQGIALGIINGSNSLFVLCPLGSEPEKWEQGGSIPGGIALRPAIKEAREVLAGLGHQPKLKWVATRHDGYFTEETFGEIPPSTAGRNGGMYLRAGTNQDAATGLAAIMESGHERKHTALITGACTNVAMAHIGAILSRHYSTVAVFDPKLATYVVAWGDGVGAEILP
jgi:hypothetical protein